MSSVIDICVIPAAGEGTRWLPLSNFVPKEMIPFGRRPVIEWSVKEAADAGCRKIIFVINKKKKVIKDYLLEHKKEYPKVDFYFVYQNKPLGIVDSILKAEKYIKNKPFILVFPDTPSTYKVSPIKQMMDTYNLSDKESYILNFAQYPKYNVLSYGECLLKKRKDGLFDVLHICPRPKVIGKSHHPGNKFRLAGRMIFPIDSIKLFKKVFKQLKSKKPDDADVLTLAIALKKQVLGVNTKGMTYEVGNVYSYMESYLKLNSIKKQQKYW